MSSRRDQYPAKRRFLLFIVVLGCAAAGVWLYTIPPADDATSALAIALAAIDRSDWDAAAAQLNRLHRTRPEDATVIRYAAEVAQRRGDTAAAIEWWERVSDTDLGEFGEARLKAAQTALEVGRPQKTEQLLHSLLDKSAAVIPARRMLARLYVVLLRITDMREQIAALDREGQATLDELLLFTVGSRAGWATDDHLAWLQKCRLQEPENVEVVAALAYYLMHQNRRAEAIDLASSFSAGGPWDWMRKLVLAEDAIDQGRYSGAGDLVASLPADANRDPRVWLARGRARYEQQDWPAAQIAYAAAELLDPYDPAGAYGTARARHRLAGADAARADFERADRLQQLQVREFALLQTEQPTVEQYAKLGAAFEHVGLIREAYACFQRVLENPSGAASPFAAESKPALSRLRAKWGQAPLHLSTWAPAVWDRLNDDAAPFRGKAASAAVQQIPNGAGDAAPAENIGSAVPDLQLEDVAPRVGLEFAYEYGHSRYRWLMEVTGGGVAVIDYDRDGRPDLFLSQGCRLPVVDADQSDTGHFFRNRSGQAFDDVSGLAGVRQMGFGQGCAVGDYDNDGFPDLVVCRYGSVLLFCNNGDGTFGELAEASGLSDRGWSSSAAFGDLDRDGDLDLYVVHYVQAPFATLQPCGNDRNFVSCRPLDYAAEDDTVWENLGDGRWADRTSTAGIRAPGGKGLGIIIADFDQDGWPDIFVGNDTTPNFLFHNRTGSGQAGAAPFSFTETGIPSGVAFDRDGNTQASMGIACDDVDGDGLFDLYVSNYQDEPDTFYHNLGGMAFAEEAHPFGLADSSLTVMGWGSQFLDLDGDRRPDLFVANGHLHDIEQRPVLYWNTGMRRFLNVSASAGRFFDKPRMGRSVAVCDWNGDLAPDLLVTHQTGPVALLENRSRAALRLAVRCVGTTSNRDAEGAVVTMTIGDVSTRHRMTAGGGYFAANDNTLLLGTGGASRVDRLEVHWPSGEKSEVHDLRAGQSYLIVEGREQPH
jgi:tetratricopeptide (TPR) repeat protein